MKSLLLIDLRGDTVTIFRDYISTASRERILEKHRVQDKEAL